jgi:hypothetical protein
MWAFFVDRATVPFATAVAEDDQLTPEGDHTVVQLTLAIDPRGRGC